MAWISSMSSSWIRPTRASSTVGERRISAMTSSSMSSALTRPRRMCARSSALRSRYRVRRTTTSIWCATYSRMNWARFSVRGTPSTSASMLAPNVSCNWVCLYRLLSTTLATASRLSTSISRMPVRPLDSSRMSAMPVSLPSLTSSATRSARLSGLTWYGSSVTTRLVRPLVSSSTSTTARIRIEPRPVRYASWIGVVPTISPAVGKSGPFTMLINWSSVVASSSSGLARHHCTAAAISRRLCGGILVAIPTAMPSEPLINRFGTRDGRIVGSCARPS